MTVKSGTFLIVVYIVKSPLLHSLFFQNIYTYPDFNKNADILKLIKSYLKFTLKNKQL